MHFRATAAGDHWRPRRTASFLGAVCGIALYASSLCAVMNGCASERADARGEATVMRTEPAKESALKLRHSGAARILFLGNSITWHGPAAAVSWPDNWGMAASAQAKDYVHVFSNAIGEMTGSEPVLSIHNIADFERQHDHCDLTTLLKEPLAFNADIVILAIGENVPALSSESSRQLFQAQVTKLLTALKNSGKPTILVRSCFWPDPAKDAILRAACKDIGGIFVDIAALSKDESNYARSERTFAHPGVAAHPGDKGMKSIADALLNALKGSLASEPAAKAP